MRITKEKNFGDYDAMISLFGVGDRNLQLLEEELEVDIHTAASNMRISGEERNVEIALNAIDSLLSYSKKENVNQQTVTVAIDLAKNGKQSSLDELLSTVAITAKGKLIRAKSPQQKQYVDAIKRNKVVFGVGPAGTGKTYLAVALAVYALKNHDVDRLILTRPAVEAGEKLGFLPGDLAEKVDPYLRPLYDALEDMLGVDYQKFIERGYIEIAPLAYMRGRTLRRSFIILDEAQNTTREQMKMFLTRLGDGSQMVVTGDITQIDLPHNVESGMKDAIRVLDGVGDIEVVKFDHRDVVRHELVSRIILAYEKADKVRRGAHDAEDDND